ncbi:MAG: SDR family oxidoreductase [Bacteroidota bacterium]
MKVLITGANGFIGQHWVEAMTRFGWEVVASGMSKRSSLAPLATQYLTFDITDELAVKEVFSTVRPDAVLHAAAISKPDVCASNPETALRVNTLATEYLLTQAASVGSYFCFISTDFVFDGMQGMYTETDTPSPINHYGHTKWMAEQSVMQYPFGWSIARTVSVYGQPVLGRANILSVVVDKLRRGESYPVVDDQIRTPTYAGDLAAGVAALIDGRHNGIFHLSGEEVMTPYQMAIRTAAHVGLDPAGIQRVTADTFTQPAQRPLRTGFKIDKAKDTIGFKPITFQEGLQRSFPND